MAVDRPSSAKPIRIATISFHITAQPVKSRISLAATNVPGASERCGRKPEGARPLRVLTPESSERERRHCVHGHGRRRDEADQLLPAGEGEEDHQAAEEGERDREERRSATREPGEGRRDEAVSSEREGEAGARARVEQAGAAGRDDCVRIEQDCEPAQAECRRQRGERSEQLRFPENETAPQPFERLEGSSARMNATCSPM